MRNILLVVDVLGWAWHHKALAIKKHLPQYNITIKTESQVTHTDFTKYDSIHYFGWLSVKNKKCTTAISSHNYRLLHKQNSIIELPKFKAIGCVSKELYELAKLEKLNKNIYLCENGVDTDIFHVTNKPIRDKFIVGWIGQKTSGTLISKPFDIKGYEHILLPLREKLSTYSNIELRIHSNNHTNAIKHSDMIGVYSEIDLLISTSFLEGTPNSVFEAASCGIPVLSTSVGCVPELIINNYNGILVNAYNNKQEADEVVNNFLDNIIYLSKNREHCLQMGINIRAEIEKNWTWKEKAKQWIPLFEY